MVMEWTQILAGYIKTTLILNNIYKKTPKRAFFFCFTVIKYYRHLPNVRFSTVLGPYLHYFLAHR